MTGHERELDRRLREILVQSFDETAMIEAARAIAYLPAENVRRITRTALRDRVDELQVQREREA